MNSKDILIAAKNLITDKEHWTTDTCARDINGEIVLSDSEEAVSYCSIGAVCSIFSKYKIDNISFDETYEYLRSASCSLYDYSPSIVNDHLGHEEVMHMFDKAIELADYE